MTRKLQFRLLVAFTFVIFVAIGAALLLREEVGDNGHKTNFKGFEVSRTEFAVSSFICKACPNLCEIAQIAVEGKVLARWGGRCDLWERTGAD